MHKNHANARPELIASTRNFCHLHGLLSKLLVSPLVTPIAVAYIIPHITPFKECLAKPYHVAVATKCFGLEAASKSLSSPERKSQLLVRNLEQQQ